VVPIVTGLDKFFHLLCNWDLYLAPVIARLSPIGGHNLMLVIAVVEVIAGLVVAFKPRTIAWRAGPGATGPRILKWIRVPLRTHMTICGAKT
jgi:hypothetical protein